MSDNKEALPALPVPAYPEGSSCTIKEEAIADFYTADQMRGYATAALSGLRAEMQQLALRSLTAEGEWIELTGKLRAEVERARDEVDMLRRILLAAEIVVTGTPEGWAWERKADAARSASPVGAAHD